MIHYRQAIEAGDNVQLSLLTRIFRPAERVGALSAVENFTNEALALFRTQEKRRGIAQTMDLLGIVSYQLGEVIQGADYLEQAVPILRELDDRQGLVNTLTNLTVRALTDTDPGFSSLLQRCTLLRWAIYPAVCGSQEKYVINIGVFETVAGQAYTQPNPNGCPSMSMFLLFIVVHLE